MHYDKISKTDLDERSFCVVLIGNNQTNLSVKRKERYVRSVESVFRQNYSNFHIVYFDNGLENSTKVKYLKWLKNSDFRNKHFNISKAKVRNPETSTF